MKKKHEIVMLQTEKAGNIRVSGQSGKLEYKEKGAIYLPETRHLYILSNKEIKEGDWMLHPNLGFEVGDIWNNYPLPIKAEEHWFPLVPGNKAEIYGFKKIIATTNPDLWLHKETIAGNERLVEQQGLPSIPHDFIEAYVKAYNEGKQIKEVELEYVPKTLGYDNGKTIEDYPNDEFKNQEELLAEADVVSIEQILKLRSNKTVIISPVKEKLYTREDLFKCWDAANDKYDTEVFDSLRNNDFKSFNKFLREDFDEWVNKNL